MPCHLRHHVDMTIGTTTSCSVLIPGPAGQIEVAFDPAEGTPQPLLAVVCHCAYLQSIRNLTHGRQQVIQVHFVAINLPWQQATMS